MSFRRALYGFAALTTLAALGGLGWYHLAKREAPARATTKDAVSTELRTDAATAPRSGATRPSRAAAWEVGTRRVYAADFGSKLGSEAQEAEGSFELVGSATLALTAAKVEKEALVLVGEISDVSIVLGNDELAGQSLEQTIDAELRKPFTVTLSTTGRIEELGIDADMGGFGHAILRSLVSSLQFVEPDAASNGREWQVQEMDQHGICRARYESLGERRFKKTKVAYTHLEIAKSMLVGDKAPEVSVKAEAELVRSELGVIERVKASELIRLPVGGGSFRTQSHVTLELSGVARTNVVLPDRERLRSELPYVARAAAGAAFSDADKKRELAAGASFDDLLAELARIRPEDADGRFRLRQRLSALFDTQPEAVRNAVSRIRHGGSPDETGFLMSALSEATGREAQAGLGEIASESGLDPALRVSAVNHLAMQESPTPETLSGLERLAAPGSDPVVHDAATLALGGAARRAGEQGGTGESARQAVQALARSHGSAQTPAERRTALAGLGNTGSADAFATVKAALSDPDPSVRASAVRALRLIQLPEADALIAGFLQHDPDGIVRLSASHAARDRNPTDVMAAAVARSIRDERMEDVRASVLDLARNYVASPLVRASLEWAIEHDPVDENRAVAQGILEPNQALARAP